MNNDLQEYQLASDFANLTLCSFFLTGKAGTGKTTFLKKLKENCHKQLAVVAPTGVAAINAGGVTMHSFFNLPFTPFVPTNEGRSNLLQKQHINSRRKAIYKNLELLIIDEISMVRADILDAIDTILRHHRSCPDKPFGGVQVILIGDMYQLSPVARHEEWQLLSQYYESPYFFHSKVIEAHPPIFVELKHIFRQSEASFINLLNEIRNNTLSYESKQLLQKKINRQLTGIKRSDYIVLTTHNNKANTINSEELGRIHKPSITFDAEVSGEFPEKNFPAEQCLTLKEGAKVMFIANDRETPHRYFNGKIGVVTSLDDKNIVVQCDDQEEITVSCETWENISYTVNPETKQIEEEVLGNFKQYPLRLAWAITVHKSQGLTFDKAIVDLAQAFAPGQVYVALSRCRSLSGVVLSSPINATTLSVERSIIKFSEQQRPLSELTATLQHEKEHYLIVLLQQLVSFDRAEQHLLDALGVYNANQSSFNPQLLPYLQTLSAILLSAKFALRPDLLDARSTTIQHCKERLTELIARFEEAALQLPSMSSDIELAQELIDPLMLCIEEVEWRNYVVRQTSEELTAEQILLHRKNFYEKRHTIQQNLRFYQQFKRRLEDIFTEEFYSDDDIDDTDYFYE